MECTPLGPVRVISVRVNANNASRTVEQIVGQKKEMHLTAFDYCIEELQRDMQSQQHVFDERSKRDAAFIVKSCNSRCFQVFVRLILEECKGFLSLHAAMKAEDLLEDEKYRAAVVEMLEVKKMAKSNLQLYISDWSLSSVQLKA